MLDRIVNPTIRQAIANQTSDSAMHQALAAGDLRSLRPRDVTAWQRGVAARVVTQIINASIVGSDGARRGNVSLMQAMA